MIPPRPRLFTIPASAPFLPTLIRALIDGAVLPDFRPRDPLELARATIFLPTRRACTLARDAFRDVFEGKSTVLPRIVALGDIDADEFIFAEAAGAAALDLPEAIGGFERKELLAQLILEWARSAEVRGTGGAPLAAGTPAAALALADDLARLMDDFATRQVSWDKLDGLVPAELDTYWQLTLRFLKIARDQWPAILAAGGTIEPAQRRDRLIAAEAQRLAAHPDGPVIAAGSTGSMPATAMLLDTIAKLPHGAVVLPGLDTHLDDAAWASLAGRGDEIPPNAGHPQFAMQALLTRIGVGRDDVQVLGAPAGHDRALLVSEAMRPANATDQWQQRLADPDVRAALARSMQAVTVIEAATAEDEALAAAVALRETLETETGTAALVTPDRALARRVAAALQRWGVAAEDSAGTALANTPAGIFARLAAETALGGLAPIALLALLKHPLIRLETGGRYRTGVHALERAVLRGPRPKIGSAGLRDALTTTRAEWEKLKKGERSEIHRSDPRAYLIESDFEAAERLVAALSDALRPLEDIAKVPEPTLWSIADKHRDVVGALGGADIAETRDGSALFEMLDELASERGRDLRVKPGDYPEMLVTALSDRMVRMGQATDGRIRILGLLEARLTSIDRVVLGGLVEGVWPPEARNDAWLSRPMRRTLGLDLPERRVGLTAHDFAQLMGAKDVILTRAAKIAGAPTVASRLLQRLAAVAGNELWQAACARGETYLAWARDLDLPSAPPAPVPRPEPKPPRAARPKALSVTDIEQWLRDPYSIYARHVLRLRPLDVIDTAPGARDRGIVIHGAIAEFTSTYAKTLPADVAGELIQIGERHFAALETFPEARAFWWPRFLRIANWFATFEAERRENATAIIAEEAAQLLIALGEREFRLSTRADRIERLADNSYAILDYKTGTPPSSPQVTTGLTPQLTLEAAMLRAGCFKDIPMGASVTEMTYVALKGGEPPGEVKPVNFGNTAPDDAADTALRRLTELLVKFEDEANGYLSKERPMFMRRPSDYDHLARVKEWSLSGGEQDEDAP